MRTWRANKQRGVRIADCVSCGLVIWSSQRSKVVKALPLELEHEGCTVSAECGTVTTKG